MTRTPPSCRAKALELLARRAHFAAELRAKLEARGYESETVEETLARLTEEEYLDDSRTARELVASRLRRAPEGRRRLAAELGRRGAPEGAIDAALAEIGDEQELESARLASERWSRRRGGDSASLARHLERKGFDGRAILIVLRERESAPGSDPHNSSAC